MNTLIYLKNLLMDPYVASLTPTSRFGVEKVCEKINFSYPQVIVEYGPGTGIFTDNLLKNMPGDSKLIAIERNRSFCRVLQKKIRDQRMLVYHDSAENVLDILKSCNGSTGLQADYIISGIPFSLLSVRKRMAILQNTHSALKKGGKFLAYQAFFQFPEVLKNPAAEIFACVRTQYVMLCLPPILVLEAVK